MLDTFILKNVMIPDPYLLHPEDILDKALKSIVESQLGCIPSLINTACP